MAEKTSYAHGTFSWVDLSTTDQSAAKSFYQSLFGWDAEDVPVDEGVVYTMFSKNGKQVGAVSQLSQEMQSQGVPPSWNSYITVDNADDAAAKAKSLGGSLMMEPFDVFDAGRMTFILDPQGAAFAIWQPKDHIGAQLVNEPGTFCWNELYSKDVEQSKGYYTQLFGWTTEQMETPTGPYTVIKNGDNFNGGMMAISEQMGPVPPHWGVYFSVADCDASSEKIKELGGQVVMAPFDAEGVGRIAVVADPQGAHFSIMKLANPDG